MTVPTPKFAALPNSRPTLRGSSQTVIDSGQKTVVSGEKRSFVVNWNNKIESDTISKSKPVRVIFPTATAATQMSSAHNSVPVVYPNNVSAASGHGTKVIIRHASQVGSTSQSMLGHTVTGTNVVSSSTDRISPKKLSYRREKDTTMDLKIGSVFSLSQASELWNDDRCKDAALDEHERIKNYAIEISDDDTCGVDSHVLTEGTDETDEKGTTGLVCVNRNKENEVTGDQMQVK